MVAIFDKYWDEFAAECSKNNILAMKEFTCCGTCGTHDIDEHRDEDEEAYVFYHAQDREMIVEDIQEKHKTTIEFYLNWDYFDGDRDYNELANKIEMIAKKVGYDSLIYTDHASRLLIKLTLNKDTETQTSTDNKAHG